MWWCKRTKRGTKKEDAQTVKKVSLGIYTQDGMDSLNFHNDRHNEGLDLT